MPDRSPGRFFFDTVTLANFALGGRFGLLVDRYGASLFVVEPVRVELAAGRAGRYAELESVEEALSAGTISQAGPMEPAEHKLFVGLLRTLGAGEASCIACAAQRGGVVVTDDRTARRYCAGRGIPVTGTIGILQALCADGTVSVEEADALLARMVETGFYSPIRRVSDLS
jgi:predicted nucleic acid-binding protein